MNIDDAVRVLNEHKHNNHEWRADRTEGRYVCVGTPPYAGEDTPFPAELTAFEAIAIAEKLERDGGRDMPATRRVTAALRAVKDRADKAFYSDVLGRVPAGDCLIFDIGTVGRISYADIEGFLAEWEARP